MEGADAAKDAREVVPCGLQGVEDQGRRQDTSFTPKNPSTANLIIPRMGLLGEGLGEQGWGCVWPIIPPDMCMQKPRPQG